MNKIIRLASIAVIFVVAFIFTTVLTDLICQMNGYYEVGIQEAAEVR